MNTCRLCKDYHEPNGGRLLVQYGVRHYAHADCALKRWGAAFFERLTPWQCRSVFPYMVAVRHGVEKELRARAALDR